MHISPESVHRAARQALGRTLLATVVIGIAVVPAACQSQPTSTALLAETEEGLLATTETGLPAATETAPPDATELAPAAETGPACPPGAGSVGVQGKVERLTVDVLAVRPHDPDAYTQGLLHHDGSLFESTGQYGRSTVRRVEPITGAVLESVQLPSGEFGEGLALADDRLYQITWQEHIAHVYDANGLELVDEHAYDGEGWGLCYEGEYLVMSDGSSLLTYRDPDTFEPVGKVAVTLEGSPVERLNELECVGDAVYANVWMTDEIVKIDLSTGEVRAVIDASGLMPPDELDGPNSGEAVLNGIAFDDERDVFYVSGKLWPLMFEACFVPEESR